MTSTETVLEALRAVAAGDAERIAALYAPDCRGWSAGREIPSREELLVGAGDRATGLSDITVEASPMELPNGTVVAEWRLTARHTGELNLGEDVVVPPSGKTLDVRGAMFAELRGGQIAAFRQYWDEADLLDQLGLLPA
ncbi:nuclear transport factor 2 family protein [Nonomuraea sp. NPDC050536]|uniref:nuclear transport factor 2 family protein n=1 Tax=Nonomuraea sp. NPDC050536 TaxID=3364366 RepID=UPI0037C8F955